MVIFLPATLAEIMSGAPGIVRGRTLAENADVGLVPAALVAVIEKR
jgi:hypothetical protein